jgi:hypothetical protein
MDEIIRAVRDCPSGALSFGIDGREARAEVDYHGTRETVIEVTRDGPYRVTGGIPLTDGQGSPETRGTGSSLEHFGHASTARLCPGSSAIPRF